MYKGEISKSGTPILPSKRARKIPEKIQVSKEDLDQLKTSDAVDVHEIENKNEEESDVSLDELSKAEEPLTEVNSEDADPTNQ